MKKILYKILILAALFVLIISFEENRPVDSPLVVETETIPFQLVTISPSTIFPGDPVMVTSFASSSVEKIYFDGRNIPLVFYEGKSHAVIPIDFNEKPSMHEVKVYLLNGMVLAEPIIITQRGKIEKPLGIPEKLGGNTPEAEKALITHLAEENAVLASVKTEQRQLWSKGFGFPLESIFVTDDYGYDRKTVGSTIVHKGTDFRATEGTEVKSLNDGVVRVARTFVIYGNTIVIDHGFGLQSFYMHLSKLGVNVGDVVKAGQVVGLSGKTGYAEASHLHISIKIDKISVDPMTFLRFFNVI